MLSAAHWWYRFPSPDPHYLVGAERVAEFPREGTNLTAVMCIVLHQVREHVYSAARHALHACLAGGYRRLELVREVRC